MLHFLGDVLRSIKYSVFTTREKENLKFHKRQQAFLLNEYLEKNNIRKLQIGSQGHVISGWLNADIEPKSREVMYLDATKPFPVRSSVFDYVFAEHMIEHVTYDGAKNMLSECFRILKNLGKIRISTPDLQFLINLYQENKSEIQKDYIKFSMDRNFETKLPEIDAIVINNFMRAWGHQFIHDEKSLMHLLQEAGFINIRRCKVGESSDPNLNGIEQHGKEITDRFNQLESFVVEAQKNV